MINKLTPSEAQIDGRIQKFLHYWLCTLSYFSLQGQYQGVLMFVLNLWGGDVEEAQRGHAEPHGVQMKRYLYAHYRSLWL